MTAVAEVQKFQQKIPDSPEISRLVKHVNHMKKMLAAAEEALKEAVRDFQEACEHDFEEIKIDNPHYDGAATIGKKCRKCFLSLVSL